MPEPPISITPEKNTLNPNTYPSGWDWVTRPPQRVAWRNPQIFGFTQRAVLDAEGWDAKWHAG